MGHGKSGAGLDLKGETMPNKLGTSSASWEGDGATCPLIFHQYDSYPLLSFLEDSNTSFLFAGWCLFIPKLPSVFQISA